MDHVLMKVYGSISPATEEMLQAALAVTDAQHVELEGDMLLISFEGIWFPVDDLIDALKPLLTEKSEGRIDHIDVEGWRLYRHFVCGKAITMRSNDLNSVLERSGH